MSAGDLSDFQFHTTWEQWDGSNASHLSDRSTPSDGSALSDRSALSDLSDLSELSDQSDVSNVSNASVISDATGTATASSTGSHGDDRAAEIAEIKQHFRLVQKYAEGCVDVEQVRWHDEVT